MQSVLLCVLIAILQRYAELAHAPPWNVCANAHTRYWLYHHHLIQQHRWVPEHRLAAYYDELHNTRLLSSFWLDLTTASDSSVDLSKRLACLRRARSLMTPEDWVRQQWPRP